MVAINFCVYDYPLIASDEALVAGKTTVIQFAILVLIIPLVLRQKIIV